MRAQAFLRLDPQYPYGPTLVWGEKSELLKQAFRQTIEKHLTKIRFVSQKFGNKTVAELERTATALYIRLREPAETDPVGRLRRVKPHVPLPEAQAATDRKALASTPEGAILFLRKASPEIVEVFPRIAGLVAEWGNLAGHAAALLREFKIPSVFQLTGAFEQLRNGDPISLDAVQPRIYSGSLWPACSLEVPARLREGPSDPIRRQMLELNLLDPSSFRFRPPGANPRTTCCGFATRRPSWRCSI